MNQPGKPVVTALSKPNADEIPQGIARPWGFDEIMAVKNDLDPR